MAGAGYKLFNTGDVLTAAQVNTYLQEQTVMVFADAAARTTALSGVLAEGMISYLKDTDAVEKYDGSSWVSLAGAASPLTTKGDLYTYSTTDARLAVGTNGETLVADSSTSTGLKWQPQTYNTVIDAKGDILAGTAADTLARLAVGANDLLLMAASGETTGLKWGGTWTTWTPTLYNITAGNGTTQARYVVIGKTVFAEFHFTFGSTSALTGVPQFSLPVAAKLLSYTFCGAATLGDYGTASYYAGCNMIPGNIVSFTAVLANGTYAVETAPSATVPFTWTTNDYLTARISYEAA